MNKLQKEMLENKVLSLQLEINQLVKMLAKLEVTEK